MSQAIQKISFGTLNENPVILIPEAGYVFRTGSNHWSKLKAIERSLIVNIKPKTFIRRYESCLECLPRKLKAALVPLRMNGKLIGFCRTQSSGLFCYAQRITRKSQVIQISPYLQKRQKTEGVYNLGRHTYSAGPGYGWTCDYRLERLNEYGSLWDILATDEVTGEFQSLGQYSLEAAEEYFNDVNFEITRDQWKAMGAMFPPEFEDDTCAICHQSMSVYSNRQGFHICKTS